MPSILWVDLGPEKYLFEHLDQGEKQKFQDKEGNSINAHGGIKAYDITEQNFCFRFFMQIFTRTIDVEGRLYLVADKSGENFFQRNVKYASQDSGLQSSLHRISTINTVLHKFTSTLDPKLEISKDELKEILATTHVEDQETVIRNNFGRMEKNGKFQVDRNGEFFLELSTFKLKEEAKKGDPLADAMVHWYEHPQKFEKIIEGLKNSYSETVNQFYDLLKEAPQALTKETGFDAKVSELIEGWRSNCANMVEVHQKAEQDKYPEKEVVEIEGFAVSLESQHRDIENMTHLASLIKAIRTASSEGTVLERRDALLSDLSLITPPMKEFREVMAKAVLHKIFVSDGKKLNNPTVIEEIKAFQKEHPSDNLTIALKQAGISRYL